MSGRFLRKVVELDRLLETVRRARADGRTVVQCHGCFDIVHPGHIRYLEFARRQGDLLIVTLTGDADVSKGASRPYIPQELRAENLAALEFVDLVYIDPSPTAESVLDALRPDVFVKGSEYERSRDPAFLRERRIVEDHGGRVIFSSGEVVFSSSRLIEALSSDADLDAQRLCAVCRRHDVDRVVLAEILRRFSGLRVAVVGDIVFDRYVFCDARDVASESPMMTLNRLNEQVFIGGAAIVAGHVAALGADARLLSNVAKDDASCRVQQALTGDGIDAHFLRTRPRMVEKTRFLVEESKLLKVDDAAHVPLDSVAEREAAGVLEEWSQHLDAVILCDFGYGAITGSLLERVLPTLRNNVHIIAADVSGDRGNLLNFRHVDVLCPAERELRATLHDFEQGLSSVAWRLLDRTQARRVIVTLHKRGLVAFDRRSQDRNAPGWSGRLRGEHLPTFADRVTDRLGCGDALLATTTLALCSKANLMQAAYLGNAAAAVEIARLGNMPIGADDLRRWLERRPELVTPPTTPRHDARVTAPSVVDH